MSTMFHALLLQGASANTLSLKYDGDQSLLVDACVGITDACQAMPFTVIDTTLSSTWVFSDNTVTTALTTGLPTFNENGGSASWTDASEAYSPVLNSTEVIVGEKGTDTVKLRSIGSATNVASASTTVGVLTKFSLCEGRSDARCQDNTNACAYAKNGSGVFTCLDRSDFTYKYSSAVGLGPDSAFITPTQSVVVSVMDMTMTWGANLDEQINPKHFNFSQPAWVEPDLWTVQINYIQTADGWTGAKQNIWSCNQDCGNCTAFIDTASHDITFSPAKYEALQNFWASCSVDGAKIDCEGYSVSLAADGRYMPTLAFEFQNQDDDELGRVNITRGYIGQPTTCENCLAFSSSDTLSDCQVGLGLKFLNRADVGLRRFSDGKMGLTFVERAAEYPNKNNLPILWMALAVILLAIVAFFVQRTYFQIPPAARREDAENQEENFRASLLGAEGPDANQGMVSAGTGNQGSSTNYNSYNAPQPPQVEAPRRPPTDPAPSTGQRADGESSAAASTAAELPLTKEELREARLKRLGM